MWQRYWLTVTHILQSYCHETVNGFVDHPAFIAGIRSLGHARMRLIELRTHRPSAVINRFSSQKFIGGARTRRGSPMTICWQVEACCGRQCVSLHEQRLGAAVKQLRRNRVEERPDPHAILQHWYYKCIGISAGVTRQTRSGTLRRGGYSKTNSGSQVI